MEKDRNNICYQKLTHSVAKSTQALEHEVSIRFEISACKDLTGFDEFIADGLEVMFHMDLAIGVRVAGSEESGIEDAVFNITADELEAVGKELDINIVGKGCALGDSGIPEDIAGLGVRELEFDNEFHSSEECGVNVVLVVGSEDRDAVISFNFLEEERGFVVVAGLVAAAVVRAFGKEGVAFVKEEDNIALFGLTEDHGDAFFRLTDILVNDLGEVNPVELQIEGIGQDLCAHGFTGARGAEEENREAAAVRILAVVIPLLIDLFAVAHLVTGVFKGLALVFRHDDIIPSVGGFDFSGFLSELMAHLGITGLKEAGADDIEVVLHGRKAPSLAQSTFDFASSKEEFGGHLFQIHIRVQRIAGGIVLPEVFALLVVWGREFQLGEVQIRGSLSRLTVKTVMSRRERVSKARSI